MISTPTLRAMRAACGDPLLASAQQAEPGVVVVTLTPGSPGVAARPCKWARNHARKIPENMWFFHPDSEQAKNGENAKPPVGVKNFGWMHMLGKCSYRFYSDVYILRNYFFRQSISYMLAAKLTVSVCDQI